MPKARWIVTADEQAARLLRVERVRLGRLQVTVEDELANAWEEHQRGRPSPRAGRSGNTYASQGHEDETRRDRFAKDLAARVQQWIERLGIERLAVFAPARFLGALRTAWPGSVADRVEEHCADLTPLSTADLARHDVIAGLMA